MAKIEFRRNENPTVGIELELGLLDANTLALTSAYGLLNARLTADGHQSEEHSHFKPELMQCVLEINTGVCETIGDADRDLRSKLAIVESACDAIGLKIQCPQGRGGSSPLSGTHVMQRTWSDFAPSPFCFSCNQSEADLKHPDSSRS